MIVTLFEPIVRILGSFTKREHSRLTAQGKAPLLMAGSLVWGLSQKSMPPL